MRVLALDPGERVGWARADVADDGTWSDLRHGITPLRDMAIAVANSLGYSQLPDLHGGDAVSSDYDLVVIESWRLYPHMAQQFVGSSFPSVQFIGMVRLACWVSGTKLIEQGARVKKPATATMAKLDPEMHAKVTRPVAHDDGHDMDAILHLWHYCFKTYPEFRGSGLSPTKEAA